MTAAGRAYRPAAGHLQEHGCICTLRARENLLIAGARRDQVLVAGAQCLSFVRRGNGYVQAANAAALEDGATDVHEEAADDAALGLHAPNALDTRQLEFSLTLELQHADPDFADIIRATELFQADGNMEREQLFKPLARRS